MGKEKARGGDKSRGTGSYIDEERRRGGRVGAKKSEIVAEREARSLEISI